MSDSEFLDRGLLEISELLRSRKVSSVEVTTAALDRIARLDDTLHATVLVLAERALGQAAEADRRRSAGEWRGPLDGVPVGVKDLIDLEGLPTGAGMPIRSAHRATCDATVARRLSAAGAVVVAKLATTEGAYAEYRPPYVAPVNPWSTDHWAGASSSGSGVAVAAGLCAGALGTDTGASIRIPSAVNGITGIRPTHGRVSRRGVVELAGTLDQVGPMARSVADAAAILTAIAGWDPADPSTSTVAVPDLLAMPAGLQGLRVGVDATITDVDDDTAEAMSATAATLARLGAQIVDVRVPDSRHIVDDWFTVCAPQAALAQRDTFPVQRDAYGQAFSELLDLGTRLTATEYHEALARRVDFRGEMAELFTRIDLLLIPTLPFPTPGADELAHMEKDQIDGLHRFTCPIAMSGHPSLALPAGFTGSGLPIGVQLIAGHFCEGVLVRAGRAFQNATDWHRRRPTL